MTTVDDPFALLAHVVDPSGRVHFMPNGGNLGDAMINAAAIQGLERAQLTWRLLEGGREHVVAGDVAVYGGGGSLIDRYTGAYDCLRFLHTLGVPVVVLPHTVRGADSFWAELPPTTVMCRDERSWHHVASFPQHRAVLAHDLAVSLDVSQEPYRVAADYRRGLVNSGQVAGRVLRAYRSDAEASQPDRETDLDLSALWYPAMMSVGRVQAAALALLMMVAPFERVRTDRLHVAVAGGLLGVEVQFDDNDYGKLTDVWNLSLRDRFPTVRPA